MSHTHTNTHTLIHGVVTKFFPEKGFGFVDTGANLHTSKHKHRCHTHKHTYTHTNTHKHAHNTHTQTG